MRDRIGTALFLALLLIACESLVGPDQHRTVALSDCDPPPTGADSFPTPVMDGLGLYGGGSNAPPTAHLNAGLAAASQVPASGAVMVAIGHSITMHAFDAWMAESQTDARLINGACLGCTEHNYDDFADKGWANTFAALDSAGLAGADVDVVFWAITKSQVRSIRAYGIEGLLPLVRQAFPNAKQIFVSNRPYAGHDGDGSAEPEAWQEGPVVRDFVLNHMGESPWLGWSVDVWANGATPRSDGLVWLREDFTDGIHHTASGKAKMVALFEGFFSTSPLTEWYRP